MEENTQHILVFVFFTLQKRKCMQEDAHLFLNPDDVKRFPFKLQLADIVPAETHRLKHLNLITVKDKRQ